MQVDSDDENTSLLSLPQTSINISPTASRRNTTTSAPSLSVNHDPDEDLLGPKPSHWMKFKKFCMCIHKPMTAEEKLTLSWLEKWTRFGRFPFKFLTHILVTIFVTILVFLVHTDNAYVVANMQTFYSIFFPVDYVPSYGFDPASPSVDFYTIQDTIDAVNNSVQSYYTFPPDSVDYYRFGLHLNDTEPVPPKMVVQSYKVGGYAVFNSSASTVDTSLITKTYNLSQINLGPLSGTDDEIKDFFMGLEKFDIYFYLYNTQVLHGYISDNRWEIVLTFDNSEHGGQVTLTLRANREALSRGAPLSDAITSMTVLVNVLTIILCATSAIISLKALGESFYLYQQTKKIIEFKKNRKNTSTQPQMGATLTMNKPQQKKSKIIAWAELPWSIKLKFFNFWFLNNIIGNIFVIIACFFQVISFLEPQSVIEYIVKFFLGFGCLLSWINLIRYFEFDRKYTVLIKALGNGMPNVLRFIVGAFPMFIGYALFGMLLFAEDTERFANLNQATVTLFSLTNGDDLQNTFRSTDSQPILSRIYFYSFIMIFIYAVANIFIAIIEDSYFTVKEETAQGKRAEPSVLNHESEISEDSQLWNRILKIHRKKDPNKKKDKKKDEEETLAQQLTSLIKQEQDKFQRDLESKLNLILNKQ